ncbi:unnamed protein product [Linum tenue]|uniref:Uncharacterized protein n=1 Tax=Linum tenue TaxID=586396 RepID=A0AAV0LKL6_9ROSI|nr:unnamed protein product [Linum tenue]
MNGLHLFRGEEGQMEGEVMEGEGEAGSCDVSLVFFIFIVGCLGFVT